MTPTWVPGTVTKPPSRVMYDAVNVAAIPADATMVAGYLDGARIPSTLPALRARFPHAQIVTIAVTAQQDAQVLDVEQGDARPDQVPDWLKRQRLAGHDPTVYCSTAMWPSVKAACAVVGVAVPHWWRAHYNGVAALEMGEIAHQYANGAYDTSVVADYWPGVDPMPTAQGADMRVIRNTDNGRCYLAGVGAVQWLETVPQLNTWLRLCGQTNPEPVTTVDLADFAHTNPREAA
jgi:hypothetical protein